MAIDEAAMRKAFRELRDRVDALERASNLFASDADLDGRNGDPVVKFDLRDWSGPSVKGKHYSECSPEFLDMLAERLHYTSEHPKEGKEKIAQYAKRDSQRARSWARRMRTGWKPPGADEDEPL